MDKIYDHHKYEAEIYKKWEEAGLFKPEVNPKGKPFTIIMPPPNANDDLHIGHARFVAIEDILARYHRMKGEAVLWLPGADHAGIETQFVFEKKLKEEGKSRFDFDSKTLYQMIWDYVQKNKKTMESQLRCLGASCDWTRNKFTLDPEVVKIVYKTFKKLYVDDLIYRGERLVNYCTRCGTAYSELEVDHIEKEGEIYTLNYGTINIATTRPETIFADVAIAVNPKDKKYINLVGKTARIPLINKDVPIIADAAVEIGIGTNALKVTPAHDFTDWEIGERHSLEKITVIDYGGKMISPTPAKYTGLYANQARKVVLDDLVKEGKLIETKKKSMVISVCYRCKNTIEILPSLQWFIKVKTLAQKAKEAVKKSDAIFAVKKYEKIYFHWLNNLKDWNISRQIVWGIQIPAWRCLKCNEWTITDGSNPEKCNKCDNKDFVQDSDTFDTWFSSGQWPFATLQTTQPGDFEKYYPTSIMETAYDILPFWVMRMMMLGIYITNNVPFKNILIHGLIRDKNGQKISKSKGNVINPLLMTDKYGTDALRTALVWGTLLENDIALAEDNIKGQKNFANKIWNASRFVTTIKDDEKGRTNEFNSNVDKISLEVTQNLDKFRLNTAIEIIYDKFWHWFCDECIEKNKKGELSKADLVHGLITFLKLLHPFMPFVTEAIWNEIKHLRKYPDQMLITSGWPC